MPATLSVEQHVDAFLDEWQATTLLVAEALRLKDLSLLQETDILPGMSRGNTISYAGSRHLSAAADALLVREKLAAKLTTATARKALIAGLDTHLPKALKTGKLSEHAIIAKAVVSLRHHLRDDGRYVFPVVFALQAKTTDFHIGTTRIVAKPIFEVEMAEAWQRSDAEAGNDKVHSMLAADWRQHIEDFDHFIVVEMTGFEEKMAWAAARAAAEAMLNIIRMFYGYGAMDDVRIGNGFIWQEKRSSLRVTASGEIRLSSALGGGGSHLQSGWEMQFGEEMQGFAMLLATTVSWFTLHDGQPDAMFERLTYFNRLISEFYCEPHDPIRLVRLVSALEAFSMIGPIDKAHNLAHRCGAAGGWGDPHTYCAIYDAVRTAYHWRNAVVHGDAPPDAEVRSAFYGLERHLIAIYLGMLNLHAAIANELRPRNASTLRREFANRIDMFFWAPSLVT